MSVNYDLTGPQSLNPPSADRYNSGLSPTRSAIAAALVGLPRGVFSQTATAPEDPEFIDLLETADLGPFTAIGLRPAVHALRAVITDVSIETPELYHRLGCHEMLSCRYVKGSGAIISPHAWGLAIDVTIDGMAETNGADAVMMALWDLAPMFNRHGFFWGYEFGLADAMHFEASDELMRRWAADGVFGRADATVLPRALTLGDRGPNVRQLQEAINRMLKPVRVREDGLFGPETRMAILSVQRRAGLPPTGAAPKPVLRVLGLRS